MNRQRTLVEETTGYSVGSKNGPQIQSVWAGRLLEEGCWEILEGPVGVSQIKWGRSGGVMQSDSGEEAPCAKAAGPFGGCKRPGVLSALQNHRGE